MFQQLAVAPTLQVREKNQPQTKTSLANVTKTLERFYSSCVFLGSFIYVVSSTTEAKPWRSAVVCISHTLSPIFPGLWHSRALHWFQNQARVHPAQLGSWGTPSLVFYPQGGAICLSLSHVQHPLKLRHTAGMQESPWGCWALWSADLPQTNPAEKDSPTGVSPPLPNLLVLFYIILYSVCQAEGGGDSSRRAEQHPEAERQAGSNPPNIWKALPQARSDLLMM